MQRWRWTAGSSPHVVQSAVHTSTRFAQDVWRECYDTTAQQRATCTERAVGGAPVWSNGASEAARIGVPSETRRASEWLPYPIWGPMVRDQ